MAHASSDRSTARRRRLCVLRDFRAVGRRSEERPAWTSRLGGAQGRRRSHPRLAARGVDLNASSVTKRPFIFPDIDHARWTALQHAVQKQQPEAVRVLLEWGAEPDATPPGSVATPLFIAAKNNDRTTVKLLLDAGADVTWTVRASAQAEPGGPLWHVVEHVMERVQGVKSRKEALELVRATAVQSKP